LAEAADRAGYAYGDGGACDVSEGAWWTIAGEEAPARLRGNRCDAAVDWALCDGVISAKAVGATRYAHVVGAGRVGRVGVLSQRTNLVAYAAG
jgi:hypothetical protein